MFLRANARAAGLVDRGERLQGTYVAAIVGREIVSVAAHFWNGMLILQAPDPDALEAVARAAVLRSARELSGLAGPRAQVEAARRALTVTSAAQARPASLDSREVLFSLDLERLRVPEALASRRVVGRRPQSAELGHVASWRAEYLAEALGLRDGEELRARARSETARVHEEGAHWILLDGGRPVSYSAFNARLPDTVQVGGVWTPRELRGHGYARAVVAASLLEARAAGARSALLFTDEENRSAITAYEALGFRPIGDYGLVMFA